MRNSPQRNLTPANWLKALLISPGVLFTAGYLLVHAATNHYLDHKLKARIAEAVSTGSQNRYCISLHSLKASFGLESLTLKELTLTTANGKKNIISIEELRIPCKELCLMTFDHHVAAEIASTVSTKIIAIDHPVHQ